MPVVFNQYTLTGDTTTSTTVAETIGSVARDLHRYDWFMVDADLKGVPLGTLDVYLQRQVGAASSTVWADWIHFPQIAQAGARRYYSVQPMPSGDITVVGRGLTPALAANTSIGGHPGDQVRCVAKQGSATMTGTTITVTLSCWQAKK